MLRAYYQQILDYDRPSPARLPIIDAAPPDSAKEALPGLKFLRDEVKQECDHAPASSSNAPYLVAVWHELVHARQPVAIYRTFSDRKARPVKVDVVADDGARWIRVNTIKNARLMMEFREIDSYLTSDDEDEARPRLADTNSVLRMGRELLAAANANPVSIPPLLSSTTTTTIPQVTMRLTRLDPSKDDADPRIGKTIQCLRDMGIDIQLGERSHSTPIPKPPTTPKLLEPTTNINLDLSALIALISDISHSPLPQSEQEAHARFEPPQSYLDWKKDRVKSFARQNQDRDNVDDGEDDGSTWENSGQHSRALAAQAIQEMDKGILEEIRDCIRTPPLTTIAFWTTSAARHRCLQIVSKIGGQKERLRADALLASTLCARMPPVPAPAHVGANGVPTSKVGVYWEHSRHPTGFLPLVPVHVYPSILPTAKDESRQSGSTFFDALAQTCSGILSHETIPVPQIPLSTTEQEIRPATQTLLPKLTVHTATSMLAGASRGHTTLTTNRSSVKAVLKEIRRVCGRSGFELWAEMQEAEKAALWILDPRSLSEGMRSE